MGLASLDPYETLPDYRSNLATSRRINACPSFAFCIGLGLLAAVATATASDGNAPAGMAADSPVKFPAQGCLPALYPPDRPSKNGAAPEPDYFIFSTPERSPQQIHKIQSEMPKGRFTPVHTDWSCLSRTRKLLSGGGEICILGLGDSIVNDTMRSAWLALLQEAYPKAKIRGTVYVRGGGGCQHYKEQNRIRRLVRA